MYNSTVALINQRRFLMKIVIAPDSFKGSISAIDSCDVIGRAVLSVFNDAEIIKMPVADGGEGTVDSFIKALDCKAVTEKVTGPDGREVSARYAILSDNTAVIEMAQASGLTLIEEDKRNPLYSTTYGTGQLIKSALDNGCGKIIIGIGGSATNDGGAGMAQALGISFKDADGNELPFGGGGLSRLSSIDCSQRDKRLDECEIIAACDVTNPLCGPNGASYIYGPQKGADEKAVEALDKALRHYAEIVKSQVGADILDVPGSGAAGGLGGGLLAFCNAKIQKGIELILDTLRFDDAIASADLVITGEGRIDYQSSFGKVPVGVSKRCKNIGVPVIAVVGAKGDGAEAVYDQGINAILSIVDKPMALSDAVKNVNELLYSAVKNAMELIKIGMKIN